MISLSEEDRAQDAERIEYLKSEFGFSFFPPAYQEVPYASRNLPSSIANSVQEIEDTLLSSVVIDMGFDTEEEYFDWQRGISSDRALNRWCNEHNKLRFARLAYLGICSEELMDELEVPDLYFFPDIVADSYATLSFAERRTMHEAADTFMYDFLKLLYQD